jgi:hypothetical protein
MHDRLSGERAHALRDDVRQYDVGSDELHNVQQSVRHQRVARDGYLQEQPVRVRVQ